MRVHLQRDLRAEEFPNLLLDIGDGKILEEEGRINSPGDVYKRQHTHTHQH